MAAGDITGIVTAVAAVMSHMNLSDGPPADVLVDDSKEAQVRELGQSIKELEIEGNYFGQFSLTVVVYDLDLAKVETACTEFYKVFSIYDAQLYEEKYNLLNAFLATVPGGYAFNLRSMYLLNANYADYSLLRRACVHGRKGSRVAGIQQLQEVKSLASSNFSQDDAVGAMPQRGFEEVPDCDGS